MKFLLSEVLGDQGISPNVTHEIFGEGGYIQDLIFMWIPFLDFNLHVHDGNLQVY